MAEHGRREGCGGPDCTKHERVLPADNHEQSRVLRLGSGRELHLEGEKDCERRGGKGCDRTDQVNVEQHKGG